MPGLKIGEMMANDDCDGLKKLADAGVEVLGDDEKIAPSFEHHCRNGTWFFLGATGALALANLTPITVGWIVAIALVVGWAINEREARKTRAQVRKRM